MKQPYFNQIYRIVASSGKSWLAALPSSRKSGIGNNFVINMSVFDRLWHYLALLSIRKNSNM
jgi:hypothetical protein